MLNGLPNSGDILKEFAGNLAPQRASQGSDVQRRIPLFVNGVGGPGAYERRSEADKKMNLDNVASYQADATTKRPRPVFTCDMAKAITAPTLLSNGERSPRLFHRVVDQLALCLPNRERSKSLRARTPFHRTIPAPTTTLCLLSWKSTSGGATIGSSGLHIH